MENLDRQARRAAAELIAEVGGIAGANDEEAARVVALVELAWLAGNLAGSKASFAIASGEPS